jgi:hypothetical protein
MALLDGTPIRLQLRRQAGFRLQEISRTLNCLPAIHCARPGPFGNPFHHTSNGKRMSAEHAARQYRAALRADGYVVNDKGVIVTVEMIRARCAFHNLACFCKTCSPWCHVDTMLEVANGWSEPVAGSGFALERAMVAAASAVDGDAP